MNRFALAAVAALTLTVPLASHTIAGDYRVGGVEVRRPWTRPAQAGMNAVGYLTLANVGAKPVKLVGVETPAAQSADVHQSSLDGGVMKMRAVADLTIPPGGKVEFAPGGYHLMLMSLKASQALGGKTPLTLVFDSGLKVKIDLSVETGPPKAAAPMAGMHMDH